MSITEFILNVLLIALIASLFMYIHQTQQEIQELKYIISQSEQKGFEPVQVIEIENPFAKDEFADSEELHWIHMPVNYSIQKCNPESLGKEAADFDYVEQTRIAFDAITEMTEGRISFREVLNGEEAEILVTCNISKFGIEESSTKTQKTFIAGNTKLIYAGLQIINASIDLYRPYRCRNNPITQIHEILHALGIPHTPLKDEYVLDMMYPFQTSCNSRVSPETIEKLKEIYS